MRLPSIQSVAAALGRVKVNVGRFNDDDYIDVRLQVYETGEFAIRCGDSQYDLDHRGFWGSSSITKKSNCREVAKDLLSQAEDQYASTNAGYDHITRGGL